MGILLLLIILLLVFGGGGFYTGRSGYAGPGAGMGNILYVLETKQGWFQRNHVGVGALIATEKGSLDTTVRSILRATRLGLKKKNQASVCSPEIK